MSEPLSASCQRPLTLWRGWDLDSNDIMEAFHADITSPTSLAPATPPRFGDVCHCQTRPSLRRERLLY